MKTLLEKQKNIYISGIWLVGSLLFIAMLQSCVATYVPARTTTTVVRREVVPPPWAPPYDNVEEVHYYYIPDIEVYYDVWNHEYIYLHDGNWVFTSSYPAYYNQYDINSAFVVVLDCKVAEPWRRHQSYVSHYPRYYYKSVYERRDNDRRYDDHDNYGGVRGFNENAKAPVYRNPRPTNLGNSRDNPRPSMNNNSNSRNYNQSNQRRTDNSRTEKNGRSYDTRQDANSNQQSGRDVSRSGDNSNTSGRRTDNNQPVNTNTNNNIRRTDNAQPAETRSERPSSERSTNSGNTNVNPSNNNNNAGNSGQNAETPRRTQPAVYTGREVGQPVRVRREAQPAAREEKKKSEQQKSTRNEDTKSSTNSSRR